MKEEDVRVVEMKDAKEHTQTRCDLHRAVPQPTPLHRRFLFTRSSNFYVSLPTIGEWWQWLASEKGLNLCSWEEGTFQNSMGT